MKKTIFSLVPENSSSSLGPQEGGNLHLVDLKMEGRGGKGAVRMRRGPVRARNCSHSAPPRVRARTAITPHCRKMILSVVPERGHLHLVFLEMEGKVG